MAISRTESAFVFLFLISGLFVFTMGVIGLESNINFNDVRLDYNFALFFYLGLGMIILSLMIILTKKVNK